MSDTLIDFTDGEREDLTIAAGRMALFWKREGLADAVRQIGPDLGYEGLRVALGAYFELRLQRIDRDRRNEFLDDEIPF
ncbi:hypothetical protein [Ruegeria conchae]|uniref:hypothetical protein n=1 Tax=Ruegeria conchae TaxID=981384 RepID=UPI0029C70CEA|nr:hypothetical protein [Ruegeria conchae]